MPVDFYTAVVSSSSSSAEEQRESLEEDEEEGFGGETIRAFLASLQSPSQERRDCDDKEEEKKNKEKRENKGERENVKGLQQNGPLCLLHHRQREELHHEGQKLSLMAEEGEGTKEEEIFSSVKMKTEEPRTPDEKAKEEEEAERDEEEKKKKEEERKTTKVEEDRMSSPVVQPEGSIWSMRALYESFLVLERIELMARRAKSGWDSNEEEEESERHNLPVSEEKKKEKGSFLQKESRRHGCVEDKMKREVKKDDTDGENKEKEKEEDFDGGGEKETTTRGTEKSCSGVHTPHQGPPTVGVVGNYDTPLTKEEEAEVYRQKEVLAPRIFTALVQRGVDIIVDAFR